ncbi:MAG: hypothetical protein WA777_03470 [Rhodanobacter sp.]
MSTGKLFFALALLLVVLAVGGFLARYLVLLLLGLHHQPLAWNTWWQYVQAMDLSPFAPYVMRIKLAGAIGFGLPLLASVGLLIPLFRSRPESLHGDARVTAFADLKKPGCSHRPRKASSSASTKATTDGWAVRSTPSPSVPRVQANHQ